MVGGTVVNMDALQVYDALPTLTASPPATDRARVPHRLFGHVDAAQTYDVARWLAEVRPLSSPGPLILVGGTGLYLTALLHGLAPVPAIDPAVRAEVRSADREANWQALAQLDRRATERLRPGDTQRIARALEVVRSTGRTLTDWQAERTGGLASDRIVTGVVLDPGLDTLADRIGARLSRMVSQGALEEVAALRDRTDVPPDAPAWRAIGARAFARHLAGELSLDDAIGEAEQATRAYTKRQRTWFRHQPPAHWARVENSGEAVDSLCAALACLTA